MNYVIITYQVSTWICKFSRTYESFYSRRFDQIYLTKFRQWVTRADSKSLCILSRVSIIQLPSQLGNWRKNGRIIELISRLAGFCAKNRRKRQSARHPAWVRDRHSFLEVNDEHSSASYRQSHFGLFLLFPLDAFYASCKRPTSSIKLSRRMFAIEVYEVRPFDLMHTNGLLNGKLLRGTWDHVTQPQFS